MLLCGFLAFNYSLNQLVPEFITASCDITNVKCYCTTPSAARAFLLTTIAAIYLPRPQGTKGFPQAYTT